jgi:electron transport complex protein RnfG
METEQKQDQEKKVPAAVPEEEAPASKKMISAMGTVGLVAAALIVFTYQVTFPLIKENKARLLQQAIFEVVPGAETKETFMVTDSKEIIPLEGEDEKAFKLYACYGKDGNLVGVAVEAQDQGFQDVIRIIYGYSPEKQEIVGMKVLQSTETPGLGDKIEKDPEFRSNFDALDVHLDENGTALAHQVELVKTGQKTDPWQIVAITGATISSKAITKMIRESTAKNIPFIHENLSKLEGSK